MKNLSDERGYSMNNLNEAFDTLMGKGGFTYSLNEEKPERYIVGTMNHSFPVTVLEKPPFGINKTPKEIFDGLLLLFIFANSEKLIESGNFLGAWLNEERIHFDVSLSFDSLDEAVETGEFYNQKAIFDTETNKSITIK